MTTLSEAAQQALTILEAWKHKGMWGDWDGVTDTLRAALAEPEGGGNLPPPFPVKFDHAIGADRFKVVRGAFWWHVLIGDSPTEHGKFRSRASAEKMAADLLREFRNGAFVQHEAALAEPVQEPLGFDQLLAETEADPVMRQALADGRHWVAEQFYTTPLQRKPLTEKEIKRIDDGTHFHESPEWSLRFARAIEAAHGIKDA